MNEGCKEKLEFLKEFMLHHVDVGVVHCPVCFHVGHKCSCTPSIMEREKELLVNEIIEYLKG